MTFKPIKILQGLKCSLKDRSKMSEKLRSLAGYVPFLGRFLPVEEVEDDETPPLPAARVAVVGAGVGGCCAAYFISRERGGEAVKVDVFERGVVGGRAATLRFRDHVYETGGSVIHTSNKYLVDLSKEFGLETKKDETEVPIGVFDGQHYLFRTGSWKFVNALHAVWRYGSSLFTMNSKVKDIKNRFGNIYSLQGKGKAYHTVPDMLRAMGGEEMYQLTQISSEEYFRRNLQLQEMLVRELIAGAIYMNYGQDLGVNAFTCLVSLAGMEEDSLWAVVGGNRLIPETALSRSGAKLHKCSVTSITRVERDGRVTYALQTDESDDQSSPEEYDVVIVATPLYEKAIRFENFSTPMYTEDVTSTTYHRTVAEFIDGEINPAFFGVEDNDCKFPLVSLTSKFVPQAPFPFCSVAINIPSEEPEAANRNYTRPITEDPSRVWKVFAPRPLTREEKQQMFRKVDAEATVDWLAYPNYNPPETFPPFELDKGVFYVNGIEKAASAMEISAIGAKNCVLLAGEYLRRKSKD